MGESVVLRSYLDLEEALVVRSRLRAEGFDALLENEHFLSINPMIRFALGNRVLTPASQREAADAFLREIERDAPPSVGEACPNCTGALRRERSLVWAMVGFFYATPYARYSGSTVCLECGMRTPDAAPLRADVLLAILLLMGVVAVGSGGGWLLGW